MSNFAFLRQSEWAMLHEAASQAEGMANTDARASCFYARRTLELAVAWLYKHDRTLRLPYQDHLSALIHEPTFRQLVGDALFTKAKLIKDLGNLAVHSTRKVMPADALAAVREIFHLCYWLARTYATRDRPAPELEFSAQKIPAASGASTRSVDELQRLEQQLKERDEKLSALLSDRAALDAELAKLRDQIAEVKQANSTQADTHDYNEQQTRDYFIDLLLKEAGWELTDRHLEVEVTGMPNNQGKGFVDYVLWGDDGKPLGLVEAKRTRRDPRVGQQQAKLYADCLEQMFGQRPVIFYSNGYEHWLWDDTYYPPRAVQGFYKKGELELLVQRRDSRRSLTTTPVDARIVERYYQTRAVKRIGETFETDRQRKALVVMATGAGKTRTVIALADLLMRCNWAKRVLFLADRVALVNQAVNAFKAHLPASSPVNLVTDKHAEGRVFVSTYPTMMGLIDEATDGQRRFGVGHFDLIVIDEAHRSVYQKYRAIFEYFDALLVGLTATPKDEIDHNTYQLFNLETGVPTDAYTLDQAVADGYLVPPRSVSVPLKFQRQGIRYDELSEDEKEQWDALEWSEDGTVPDEVDAAALNQWLFNIDTVDRVLAHLMTNGQKVAGGDVLGKTIIFAKNNDHAEFIAERFNANYPHYQGAFARVVTYKTEYAQSLIDAFSDPAKLPHIAISVDMLDTGIDVPEVVNLVFFKAVRSRTKFWQMVGRGTRLRKDLYGPGQNKQFFYLFDYCQNLEFFSQNPQASDGSTSVPLSTRLFRARLELIRELSGRDDEATDAEKAVNHDIRALLHAQVEAMNIDNFVVRPQRRLVEQFRVADVWQSLQPTDYEALSDEVAKLPTELVDQDEDAKRFDLMVLRTQLSLLQAGTDFGRLREQIQTMVQGLEEKQNIPAVKTQLVLIQAVGSDEWWQDVTVPMLETMRKHLRALIKLLDGVSRNVVYTNFADELGPGTVIDLPEVSAGLDLAKFKDKARQFLRTHADHLALQRLRRNQPLTEQDLQELERMLNEAGGTAELLAKVKAQSHSLGRFIRSLVGLEKDAAMEAFSGFVRGQGVTANQIEFIHLIVDELTQTGVMSVSRLYESPFTDINPRGPEGIFSADKVSQLLQVLEVFESRAA